MATAYQDFQNFIHSLVCCAYYIYYKYVHIHGNSRSSLKVWSDSPVSKTFMEPLVDDSQALISVFEIWAFAKMRYIWLDLLSLSLQFWNFVWICCFDQPSLVSLSLSNITVSVHRSNSHYFSVFPPLRIEIVQLGSKLSKNWAFTFQNSWCC